MNQPQTHTSPAVHAAVMSPFAYEFSLAKQHARDAEIARNTGDEESAETTLLDTIARAAERVLHIGFYRPANPAEQRQALHTILLAAYAPRQAAKIAARADERDLKWLLNDAAEHHAAAVKYDTRILQCPKARKQDEMNRHWRKRGHRAAYCTAEKIARNLFS